MTEQKLTYEELLRVEQSLQTYLELNGISGVMLENFKMTAAAIEKQVAMKGKPAVAINLHCRDRSVRCPICGKTVLNMRFSDSWRNKIDKYCSNCGQKIDWSECDEKHHENIRGRETNTSGISTNKKQRRSFIFKGLRKNKLY